MQTTKRYILRCPCKKKCKAVLAFDCPTETKTKYTRGFAGIPGSAQAYTATVAIESLIPDIFCTSHKRRMFPERVKGIKTDHVCDARCTSAKGSNCECSCGGANHGSDYLS